jgi:tellurite resistance protein
MERAKPATGPAVDLDAAESFAGVLVGVAACDGEVSHLEALEVLHAVGRASLFRGIGDKHLHRMMKRLGTIAKDHGPEGLLATAAPRVPRDLRASAFAWATDIAYADGRVSAEEADYLRKAAAALSIPEATAAKILEVARIRNAE